MPGEDDLLISAVRDFNSKVIDNYAIGIERDGISREIVSKIAEQGYFGLTLPVDKGGAGVSNSTYLGMLKEFAVHSPSVAALIMTVNSVILPIVESSDEIMQDVISGKSLPSLPLNPNGVFGTPLYSTRKEGGRISGEIPYAMDFGWESAICGLAQEEGEAVFIRSGASVSRSHAKLGFRGIGMSALKIDSGDFVALEKKAGHPVADIYGNIGLETAAIGLGIAEGSLLKAIEYARVRSTFEHLLKDYQPIAFPLSTLLGEKEILERFLLYRDSFTEKEKLYAKLVSVDLARKASRQSIQTHGGYGYLEDFGVEKFYRDSMALSVLFGNRIAEQKKLSEIIFESKSGFI